ncbi:tRNA methyl transferase, putative [Plasmodium vivax]|uniref:tRNA methyl transferase, putative n=3 Tax=Plasmodium vivax TaxID=5855 RepID=A5KCE1_PLAVS|nr:tRNA methyl transferase, putative [Plasmodium vivax]EDL43005.1 tRNA methyl transferase, putative [Plasmodium vivax]KMZ94257.1 tRNA methyl transferase [Plasmodium vivax Mauritania I]KNA00695.1 tRNA methyl transferase [Plasmodium vivax North Korean]|eukprot:XP_001612732.1 tRNA methyl transferase [Plasmodium vivax Sal-1]
MKGALRRRLSRGETSPSTSKLNERAVTPLSSEQCRGDETKRNERYEARIRNVCEELRRMTDREDKMKHLMEHLVKENTNGWAVSFGEPVVRKSFTLRGKSKRGSAGRNCFVNEVRAGVSYRYVERCNSNLFLGVDVVEAGKEAICNASGDASCPPTEQAAPPSGHSLDGPHWRSILGGKKFWITVDGFSDNIVLRCFLRVLLEGLKDLDLERFLSMGFEGVVSELSSLYTIHQYPRVAHMLSGGVDSLMALRLLERKKFYVHNFYLHFAHQDCSKSDLQYVKQICSKRKNLFIVNVNEEYTEQVLIPMLRSYSEGQIPNADILCNEKVKYHLLMRTMRKLCRERGGGWNYSYVSTGHYAMISTNDEANANRLFNGNFPYVGDELDGEIPRRGPRKRYKLIVGRDERKDQTFFLSSFSEKQLSKFLFPLCLRRKSDVKRIMERRAAGQYNRRETRGLCLYGRVDMHSLLGLYLGGAAVEPAGGQPEGGRDSVERGKDSVERGKDSVERESDPIEGGSDPTEAALPIKAATPANPAYPAYPNSAARRLQWAKDQLHSPEFRAFREKHLPSFNLRFKNYIISVEDGTVMDTNEGVHLYAIGQKKYITNHLHQLYNSKGKGRGRGRGGACEKNVTSSCQWTVVYKKMLRRASGNVKENFIYVSRDYESGLFRQLRGRCRLGAFRWVASAPPSHLGEAEAEKRQTVPLAVQPAMPLTMPLTVPPIGRPICVKVRNSEEIKEAQIALDDAGQTAYLTLRQKDIGLSPGQIVTFYLPFIVKRSGRAKYLYSLRRRKGEEAPPFFHCLGSARITNQYLNRGLYRRLMEIHRRNSLPLWGRDARVD